MSNLRKDICRVVGCTDKMFCLRCEEVNMEIVTTIVTDGLYVDKLEPSDIIAMDELDAIEIIMAIEDEFDIEIDDEETKEALIGVTDLNPLKRVMTKHLREKHVQSL